MKHRLTVPFGNSPDEADQLHEFVYSHGWYVTGWVFSHRLGPSARWISVTIAPNWGPAGVELRAVSGATLVFDDIEKSMGATWIAEPHDAVPPQPRDAALPASAPASDSLTELFLDSGLVSRGRSFLEKYADPSLFQDGVRPHRRRRRGR